MPASDAGKVTDGLKEGESCGALCLPHRKKKQEPVRANIRTPPLPIADDSPPLDAENMDSVLERLDRDVRSAPS
jgi:hypothetical protein